MSVADLGIAGLGLIGGSIARRMRLHDPTTSISAYDRDPVTLEYALKHRIVDRAQASLGQLALSCRTLVIALPVDATGAALIELRGLRGPALVLDVASVKGPLAVCGAGVAHYVGTHPMAGREQGGILAADPALFENAAWAYTPRADPALIARTRDFIAAMGARPVEIDAKRHDAVVALTSHVPQALAVVLGSVLAQGARDDEQVMELCGPGMMSMLRLARSPEAVWSPIIAANAAPLAKRLRSIADALEFATAGLEAGDSEPLMSYFKTAHDVATRLEQRDPPKSRSSTERWPEPPSQPSTPPSTR